MTEAEILTGICADLPEVACEPGCIMCCTVALWSPAEWARLPQEFRAGVGLARIPMRGPRNARLVARLPVREEQLLMVAGRRKLAVTEPVAKGILLTSFGLEGLTCPFAQPGQGCTVYEYRPFTCRIMGASAGPGRLACPRGFPASAPLPETVIMQRFLLWTNLFPRDPLAQKPIKSEAQP